MHEFGGQGPRPRHRRHHGAAQGHCPPDRRQASARGDQSPSQAIAAFALTARPHHPRHHPKRSPASRRWRRPSLGHLPAPPRSARSSSASAASSSIPSTLPRRSASARACPRDRTRRQGQGHRPLRVRGEGLCASPPMSAHPAASSCCRPRRCPAIPIDGHTLDALSALSDLLWQTLRPPLSSSNAPHSGASVSSHDQNRGEAYDHAKPGTTTSDAGQTTKASATRPFSTDRSVRRRNADAETPAWRDLPEEARGVLTVLMARLILEHAQISSEVSLTEAGHNH